ncbi:MAG: hypothetical protein IIC22_05610, partial [Chloroflexi bacterium]|nr:hypothetical protein [Chloroflexota bacterium]
MDKGYPKYELEPSLRVTTLEELMEHFRSKDIAAALGKLKLPTSGTKRDRIECLLDWAGQPDEAAIYARQDDYIPTDSWIDLDYDDIRNSWHNYPYDIVTKVLNEFDLESQNRVNERLNLTWTMKYYLNHRFTGEKELDLGEYILGIRKSDSLEATHVTSESFQCPYCGEQRSMSNPWPMALGGGVSGKRWQCRMCGKLVGERVVASTLERFIVPFLNFPVMASTGALLGLATGLYADWLLASEPSDAALYIVYGIASALSGAFVGIFYGIRGCFA